MEALSARLTGRCGLRLAACFRHAYLRNMAAAFHPRLGRRPPTVIHQTAQGMLLVKTARIRVRREDWIGLRPLRQRHFQRPLHDFDREIDFRPADNQRRNHTKVDAPEAEREMKAAFAAAEHECIDDHRRSLRPFVPEIESDHQPLAANIGDHRLSRGKLAQPAEEVFPTLGRALEQVLFANNVDNRAHGRGRHRIGLVARKVPETLGDHVVRDFGRRRDRRYRISVSN